MNIILRNDDNETLYCQDGNMRSIASTGSAGCCIKIWTKSGFANRAAIKFGLENYTLIYFYPEKGESINEHGIVQSAKDH